MLKQLIRFGVCLGHCFVRETKLLLELRLLVEAIAQHDGGDHRKLWRAILHANKDPVEEEIRRDGGALALPQIGCKYFVFNFSIGLCHLVPSIDCDVRFVDFFSAPRAVVWLKPVPRILVVTRPRKFEALNTYGGSDASFVDVDVHAGCDLE